MRREIIRTCAQFDSQVEPRILPGLLDKSVGVAGTAIYYAKKLNFDFKGFYLNILSHPELYSQRQLYRVIYSVREMKIEEIYKILFKNLYAPSTIKFRVNILKSLVNYDEFNFNKEIINMCAQQDPLCAAIDNSLLDQLPTITSAIDSEMYCKLLNDNYDIEVKCLIVKIILRVKGFWNTIIAIMNIYDAVSNDEFKLLGL